LVIAHLEHKHPFCSWITVLFPNAQKTRSVSPLPVQVGHLLHWQKCSICTALFFWSASDMPAIIALYFASKESVFQVSISAIITPKFVLLCEKLDRLLVLAAKHKASRMADRIVVVLGLLTVPPIA